MVSHHATLTNLSQFYHSGLFFVETSDEFGDSLQPVQNLLAKLRAIHSRFE